MSSINFLCQGSLHLAGAAFHRVPNIASLIWMKFGVVRGKAKILTKIGRSAPVFSLLFQKGLEKHGKSSFNRFFMHFSSRSLSFPLLLELA
jgi:hypothetical protein